jgi:hypothetical protein
MPLSELLRLFKEILCDDGEKLRRICCPILVQEGRAVGSGIFGQLLVIPTKHPRLGSVYRSLRQNRSAVHGAILLVKLMGELVEHNISSVMRIGWATERMIPGNDDYAGVPRFAGSDFVSFH